MRIILLYPPPWQIPSSGDPRVGMPFGPPRDMVEHTVLKDGDFLKMPYGVLTIAAQAKRAGHEVSVFNLANSLWRDVVDLIAGSDADVYGISAFTANRRGMGAVAALIRQHHPRAHITAGGPFVTALPFETLHYFQEIDTAVIGEGEDTFMELIAALDANRTVFGIPGTAWRGGGEILFGPPRPPIKDLDSLASPFDYFSNQIVLTSRGCPGKCSFCGSATMWGKSLRFHSAKYSIDACKKALARQALPILLIKDDTFTANRRRVTEICDAIIESNMNFLWSCDTRVDSLNEELLYKMRLAGCQAISFGVESGSPQILASIRKKTTPGMVLEATRLAQKYGMYVRYYMMIGNRGESPETIRQSVDLIKAGRPSKFVFCSLSFYPGTEEWEILREQQGLAPNIFFENDFREFSIGTNRNDKVHKVLKHIYCSVGSVSGFNYTVEEREAIVGRLPNLHVSHVELANAYYRAGKLDLAVQELDRAEELGFPMNAILDNQRACIAQARNGTKEALALLDRAAQHYPHQLVRKNQEKLRTWVYAPADSRGKRPALDDSISILSWVNQPEVQSIVKATGE